MGEGSGRDRRRRRAHSLPVAVLCALAATVGCGDRDEFDAYLGEMDSTSYAGQRWRTCGPNALGEDVAFADFEGRFLWVDYSASWCGPCRSQASILRQLEEPMGDKVVFLTVMVDGGDPMTEPTLQTAKDWAARFGLDAARVVSQRTYVGSIPHHFLYSPSGQLLYRESGVHSADLIRAKLTEQMREWRDWRGHTELAGP